MTPRMLALLVATAVTTTGVVPVLDGKSIAVLQVHAKEGVTQGAADLLTDQLVTLLRQRLPRSRVVSSSELQDALTLERTRQLVDCDSSTCAIEIAGALGADYVVSGSAGRLDQTVIFNLRVINARTGVGEATVTRLAPDTGGLARSLDSVVAEMLGQLHGRSGDAANEGGRAASSSRSGPLRLPARVTALSLLGVSGGLTVLVLVLGAGALGVAGVVYGVTDNVSGAGAGNMYAVASALFLGAQVAVAVAGVLVPAALILVAVSAGGVVGAWLL